MDCLGEDSAVCIEKGHEFPSSWAQLRSKAFHQMPRFFKAEYSLQSGIPHVAMIGKLRRKCENGSE
jgi:hypothetical protein